MPMLSRIARHTARKHNILAATAALAAACTVSPAPAQDASYFSPTYAASEGSPYSSVYARTFGAGGPPPPEAPEAPLETAAAPPARAPAESPSDDVVYVIEDGRLLTYRAEDYARGGRAVAGTPVPPTPGDPALSSIAGRLYGTPPARPEADAAGPIPLVPPQN